MPRPKQRPSHRPLIAEEIEAACYVGSPEHKEKRWWGGLPAARKGRDGRTRRPKKAHTTICRKTAEADRREATRWVREALAAGQMRFFDGDKTYPKHIWYKDKTGQFWFGFAVN